MFAGRQLRLTHAKPRSREGEAVIVLVSVGDFPAHRVEGDQG